MSVLGNSGKSAVQEVLDDLLQTDIDGNLIIVLNEIDDPAAPPAGSVKLYAKSDGSGGTSLYCKLPTGQVVTLAGN